MTFEDGYRKAREAATEAIWLDDGLAESWAAMGAVKAGYDWDWAGAELALGKARALAPGNIVVLDTSVRLSATLGRRDQAIAFARQAVELDPLSVRAHSILGRELMRAGRLQEAEVAYLKVLEFQPGRTGAHMRLGQIELLRSQPEAALAQMEKETTAHWRVYGQAMAYHALGRRDESDAALNELEAEHGDDVAFQMAEMHAFRGERDKAFEWLERGYSHRDPGLPDVKATPFLANLHDDPRWPVFLEKMGLPL